MNEFSIEWIKGAEYAGVTVPFGTALKSKLHHLAEEYPDDVKIVVERWFFACPCSGEIY